MTQIHAFFVSLVKKEDMAQATVDKCLESVYYVPKGEGADSLYRDAFLGIATSRTDQYHGYYCRKYFDIL